MAENPQHQSGNQPGAPIPRVLIADDQRDVLESLRLLLKTEGFAVTTAPSPEKALDCLQDGDFDVLLMDLNYARDTTSGQEGLELLPKVQELDAFLPIVVMTAWSSVEVAVEAMRRGARDFVEKPWDNHRLVTILRTQTALGRALRKGQRLEAENQALRGSDDTEIVSDSPAMAKVLSLVTKIAPSEANVLITGENGTGKSLLAGVLHRRSNRDDGPLITVNLGGLTESLFESELFGHTKGAFTDARSDRVGRFELASQGTLFLDEVANVPLPQQAKLLRVLESGEFERVGSSKTRRSNARILSATNANLPQEVEAGRFRQDLLFRLNTVEIRLPPLRERREDIPPLAEHFLRRFRRRYRKDLSGFDDTAMQQLRRHPWPGNVRELSHAVERSVLLAGGPLVRAGDLHGLEGDGKGGSPLEEMTLEGAERLLIERALERFDGSVSDAAKTLGLSRSALYRRLEKHSL